MCGAARQASSSGDVEALDLADLYAVVLTEAAI